MLRENIYYWKCDSPISIEDKQGYNDKYQHNDLKDMVYQIAQHEFGQTPISISGGDGQGNHYTYLVHFKNRSMFFRSDDGKTDDEYMIAENHVMKLMHANGVPVPELYACDTSKINFPIRYQFLELVGEKSLNEFHKENRLNIPVISHQLGQHMARIHQIHGTGFGFLNTNEIQKTNSLKGLDTSHRTYFNKCLENQLNYLGERDFLEKPLIEEIKFILNKFEDLTDLKQGVLVHKDLAFWNIMGTENKINALIDWDDVILGDPMDDLSILHCFYDKDIIKPLLEGYQEVSKLPEHFDEKITLYLLRNMIWKSVIRLQMNYFEKEDDFFITNNNHQNSLKEITLDKINKSMNQLKTLVG